MAGKESGKLVEYVQSKNSKQLPTRQTVAPSGAVSFDDLRYDQSRTKAAPNSGQVRSNDHYPRKSAQAHGSSQGGERDTIGERAFYDTDASSIEASSIAASPKHGNVGMVRSLQDGNTNGRPTGVEYSDSADGDQSSGDERCHRELPQNQLEVLQGDLNDRQRQLMHQHDSDFSRTRHSRDQPLPYMKGDSYPVTTSGNASAGDTIEMKAREKRSQERRQTQDQAQQYASMHAPLITANALNQAQSRPDPAEDDPDRSAIQYGLIVRPDSGDEGLLEHQTGARFVYCNPNRSQPALHPAVKSHRHSTREAMTTQPSVSNNTAHRATISSANDRSNVRPHLAQETVQIAGKRTELQQHRHQRAPKSQNKRQTCTQVEQQGSVAVPEDDEASDVDVGIQDRQPANDGMQQHVLEPEGHLLDYSVEDLSRMDYHKLKAESFDSHPNAKDFEFPPDQQGTDLNSKLDAVAALSQQQQGNFFASLPIMEWEQAGDWFITQFGAMLNKLKTNRREKREAAKAFENEIENRHERASTKRKQTEDELSEMKESGDKVLLRETPKKVRTK